MKATTLAALASVSLLTTSAARAADHTNLEEGIPVEAADAYAISYLNREVQGVVRYQHEHDRTGELRIDPRFEVGVIRNGQLSVRVPTVIRTDETIDLGRVQAEGMYNLNQETLTVPALGLGAAVEAPTGREGVDRGFDPHVRANLTKHLPFTVRRQALHVNAIWVFNAERRDDERAGRYKLIGAYSVLLSASTMMIVDVVREQRMETGKAWNLAELGFRVQLTPLLVMALGGGAGFLDESPKMRVAFGLQYRPF